MDGLSLIPCVSLILLLSFPLLPFGTLCESHPRAASIHLTASHPSFQSYLPCQCCELYWYLLCWCCCQLSFSLVFYSLPHPWSSSDSTSFSQSPSSLLFAVVCECLSLSFSQCSLSLCPFTSFLFFLSLAHLPCSCSFSPCSFAHF